MGIADYETAQLMRIAATGRRIQTAAGAVRTKIGTDPGRRGNALTISPRSSAHAPPPLVMRRWRWCDASTPSSLIWPRPRSPTRNGSGPRRNGPLELPGGRRRSWQRSAATTRLRGAFSSLIDGSKPTRAVRYGRLHGPLAMPPQPRVDSERASRSGIRSVHRPAASTCTECGWGPRASRTGPLASAAARRGDLA